MEYRNLGPSGLRVSVIGLGLLTLWMVLAYRSQRRALADLEARGIRRRARPAGTDTERLK